MSARDIPHVAACDADGCYCPDDVFWGRLLGDDDPCAPGKDWVAAAFGDIDDDEDGGDACLGCPMPDERAECCHDEGASE